MEILITEHMIYLVKSEPWFKTRTVRSKVELAPYLTNLVENICTR